MPDQAPAGARGGGGKPSFLKGVPTPALVAGGAGILYIGYRWFKGKTAAASSSSTTGAGIDPATGVPYATELANAQAQGANTGGGGSSGGGGGGYPWDYAGTGVSGTGSVAPPITTPSTTPITTPPPTPGLIPVSDQSTSTTYSQGPLPATDSTVGSSTPAVPSDTIPVPTTNGTPTQGYVDITPAQASDLVTAGTLGPAAALAAEVPASQETPAERHAQEKANKALRAELA